MMSHAKPRGMAVSAENVELKKRLHAVCWETDVMLQEL